jgi:hypothetical protein
MGQIGLMGLIGLIGPMGLMGLMGTMGDGRYKNYWNKKYALQHKIGAGVFDS